MNGCGRAGSIGMTARSILVVDDHPLFAAGFAHMAHALRPCWTLHTANSAAQALAWLNVQTLHLAIIDVGLPDQDGFALLKALADTHPALPKLLMSGREDEAIRIRARASGAAGFVAKTEPPDVFVAMIERVLAGGAGFTEAAPSGDLPVLTVRQAEILALLGEGHANKEIRFRLGIAERTVRAHLTELFHLLGASSRMQAVIRGRELGLLE